MSISLDLIKTLRERTGVGAVDAKKVLEKTDGNIEKAMDELKKQGQKIAQKKAGRSTGEGFIGSYVHMDGKTAALVSLRCETDFVARNQDFQTLARDIAMQVAAMKPEYVRPEEIAPEVLEKEKSIYREQLQKQGKPANLVEKIVEGKINSFYQEVCLLNQKFFKDEKKTIDALITEYIQKLGENIQVDSIELLII